MEIHKQPFHMDGMKIVCNVCGEKFSNVVLFGNHTHRADQKQNNMAFQRSVPKPDHKTFSTMSEEEMVEAFHKMPELEGCWIKNGRYVCNMCGKSCPNPYLLFSHKIIHPSDMTPFSRVKETDFQQTQGVATQTTIEHGFRNCKRNHKGNLIKDHGKKIKKVWDISCESSNKDVEGDDDGNVQNVVKPKKKPKVTNPGKQKAKPQETLLYKSLISVDKMSTNVKSKPPFEQIVMEPMKKSKPSTGGVRMDLSVSSDNQGDQDDSMPNDNDVDGGSICNQPERSNQKPETSHFKKKETHLPTSLIAVKGHGADQKQNKMASHRSVPKADHKTFNTNSEKDMVEAFHKMPELEGCWIKNGRYICNMCGKSCPNPYVLFSHKIHHPADMTPFSRVKGADLQQTHLAATQTTLNHGFRDCKRNLNKDQENRLNKVQDSRCQCDNNVVDGDDNIQNVTKVVKPMKNLKVMKAKTPDTFLFKTSISVDWKSTSVKSKPPSEQTAMEPENERKQSAGGYRMDFNVSSDNEDEENYSIPNDSDVDGDSIGNQPARPKQKLDFSQFKKKETCLYRSLITFKGQPFVKPMKPPPYEYCVNLLGHNIMDKCKLMMGRYYCDECPGIYSCPSHLLNHKLYHAKMKDLNKRLAVQEGTTIKKEEAEVGITNNRNEAQVGTTDKEEEAQMGTTVKEEKAQLETTVLEEETQLGTIDKKEEAQVEEDGIWFECNMCQVKFCSADGLADHIKAHAVDTRAGISCTFSDSACAVSKVSTSACSTEMTADAIVVKVKEEPITSCENDQDVNEPQLESSELDTNVRIKDDREPAELPQHSTEHRVRIHMDGPLEDVPCLKRTIFGPVVRLKKLNVEPNEVYIVKYI